VLFFAVVVEVVEVGEDKEEEGSFSEEALLVAVPCVDNRSNTLPLVAGDVGGRDATPSSSSSLGDVGVLDGVFTEEPRFTADLSTDSGDGRVATDVRFESPVVVVGLSADVPLIDDVRLTAASPGDVGLELSRRDFCVPYRREYTLSVSVLDGGVVVEDRGGVPATAVDSFFLRAV